MSIPVKGSVPASRVVMYWLDENPSFVSKYVKKSKRSPEKSVACSVATNEYTVVSPFGPVYKSNVVPAIVVVPTEDPVTRWAQRLREQSAKP